jgi:YD repeat-containing protein
MLIKISSGQAPANFNPPTPMAQQFEKYINYPVDHTTGAASVDVPLYTLKAGSIQIPISLSYHTSGVKPGDPMLPVGLGWTINPGARITRKVMNYPDEMYPKPPYQETINSITDRVFLENMEYGHPQYPTSNRTAVYDPEYDIFTYYTGTGISGRFIIQKQGSEFIAVPLLLTRDKIIIYPSSPGAGDVDYFEIIDASGILYRFGKGLTGYSTVASGNPTTESTLSGFNNTGWMLTDIISSNKADTVSFKWINVRNDPGNNYKTVSINDQVIITDQITGTKNGVQHEDLQWLGWHQNPYYAPGQQSESFHLMNVIAGLRYKTTDVNFIYVDHNTASTKLNGVEIYSQGIKTRKINFHKSFFTNANLQNTYLRLDSVSIIDKNDQVVSRYRFGYNLTTHLPTGPSREIDFWGYYNGATSNTTLVPNFTYTVDPCCIVLSSPYTQAFTTTNRLSNNSAAAYILNSITYPTGGKTTYEYEVNQIYDALAQQTANTGGLRVKKISHWAVDGQLSETRSFFYGLNECGYGDGLPMEADMYVDNTRTCHYEGGALGIVFRKRVLTGSPVNSLYLYEFPPVTYQQVTEYVGDKNGANTGKIVYRYTPGDYPLRRFMLSQSPYSYMDRYWRKPQLSSKTVYKNTQGTYTPVKYDSTTYFGFESDTIKTWLVRRWAYITANSGGNGNVFEDQFYIYFPSVASVFDITQTYLYRGITAPRSQRNVEYTASGDSIVVEQTYGYANNDYLYPKTLTTTNSNGATTITHYTYPKDYDVGTSPTNSVAQGIKLLKDRNVAAVIEEYTEVQPGNVIKSGQFTTYKTDKPLPENIYSLNTIASAGSFSPATITSSSHAKSSAYNLKSTADLYDQFGNIRQMTDKTGNITTVILYSYGGRFPIAVIKNATYSAVTSAILGGDAAINDFASGYSTDGQVNSFLSSLRSSLPLALITTYTHDVAFGVTSQTDENGRTTYYTYDAFGRLQLIKDKDGNVVKTFEYKYKQ